MGTVAKRKVGRPKELVADLPEGWQEKVLDLYETGATDVEVRVMFRELRDKPLSIDLFNRWIDEEPEFSKTIHEGRLMARTWWEKAARRQVIDGKGNSTTLMFMLKNRWKEDFQDVRKVEGNVSHTHDHRALQAADQRIGELIEYREEVDVTPPGED